MGFFDFLRGRGQPTPESGPASQVSPNFRPRDFDVKIVSGSVVDATFHRSKHYGSFYPIAHDGSISLLIPSGHTFFQEVNCKEVVHVSANLEVHGRSVHLAGYINEVRPSGVLNEFSLRYMVVFGYFDGGAEPYFLRKAAFETEISVIDNVFHPELQIETIRVAPDGKLKFMTRK